MTSPSVDESQHLWLSLQSLVMRSCTTAEPSRAEAVVVQLLQTVGERANLAALFLRQKDKPILHWEQGAARALPETSIGITTFRARVGRETLGIFVVDPGAERTLDQIAREGLQCIGDALAGLLDRERLTSALKQEQASARASVETYRSLFDSVSEAVCVIGRDGRFVDANAGALALYGCRLEDLVGQPPSTIAAESQNDLEHIEALTARAFEGESQRFVFWGRNSNGRRFPTEVRLRRGTHFGEDVVFAIGADITDRRAADEDRLRLEAQVRHSQKLESIGVLAGGIAHDFNNLLTSILGNASLARLESSRGGSPDLVIAQIELAARRAAELTKQLLAYAGKGRVEAEAVSVSEIVDEMASLLSTAISKNATLELQTDAALPAVLADPAQLRQIVMNLITNASDALNDERGTITVRTEARMLTTEFADFVLGDRCEPGHYVVLEVTDTGHGMESATAARVFEPFFTTKPHGRGLGLAALLGILRAHEGAVRVESQPGHGTTFTVVLPVTERERERVVPSRDSVTEIRPDGHILVVDDEAPIRRFLADFLGGVGFSVVLAATGREALARLDEDPRKFSAVLLDLTMPDMGGAETLRHIRDRRTALPVVLMSGFPEEDVVSRLGGLGISAYLQKPFGAEEVVGVLSRLVNNVA
jgi:two-component system, cell cycle sensor histidine kinase and response regulator CckA